MAKKKPNKRLSKPDFQKAWKRRTKKKQNREAAKKCIFDKAVHPSSSSKKIQACSIASKVSFKDMKPEEQEKVSMYSTVNIRFRSFPNEPSF